jgi:esterase/lipase superfamily enzyme
MQPSVQFCFAKGAERLDVDVVRVSGKGGGTPFRRIAAIVAKIGIILLTSGCTGRPIQGVLIPQASASFTPGASRVPVLVATTRRRSADDPGAMFNGERAENVSYAAITVSIPPDSARKIGAIQWPETLPGDPARNFVTVSADYLNDKAAFAAAVSMAAKKTSRNKALVFIHGFNNRFDDAVYRFAQIVHDSKTPAIPILFTWPSKGEVRLRAYTYDRESANYSRDALEELIGTIASSPNVKEINILAHSMGNWVTLEALRGMAIRSGKVAEKVKNVMLVAPDVDVDVFRTQIRRIGASKPHFLLLASQDDKALSLSQTIWGGVPRLGEINPGAEPYRSELEREHILVFDLTNLGGEAHDRAFADVTSVVAMIKQRLSEGQQLTEDRSGGQPVFSFEQFFNQ